MTRRGGGATRPRAAPDDIPGRRRLSARERREQLIQVARGVFAERGYAATSIEEIAERAKVSKPLVYEHFGGKDSLYGVIIDREVRALTSRITTALPAEAPRASLEQAVDAFLRYVEDEQDGFRILVRDAPVGSGRGSFPSVLEDVAATLESRLGAELKSRGYDRKMAPVLARALVGAVALPAQWWLEARRPRRSIVAATVVNLVWNGLKDLEHTN